MAKAVSDTSAISSKISARYGYSVIHMVYNLFLSLSICLWSVHWIRKGNIAGIQAGITAGVLMLIVSIAVFIQFNRIDILLFDGVRAFLMVVFGVLAYKEDKKHQSNVSYSSRDLGLTRND